MGLTLRKLEDDEERLRNLRDKIFQKHKVKGLHIAEFIQNGILNRYIGILLEEISSIEDLEKNIDEILKNIEEHIIFVQGTSKEAEIIRKANTIVDSCSPYIFIIAGFKSAAKIVVKITGSIKIILKDYEFEKFSTGKKEILFFKRIAGR